ncbi:MAG: PAS domain S-box protein [Thermacetogeniaceae bacterium]
MKPDWQSKIYNSTIESITATHLISLLICIWTFLALGVPRGESFSPAVALVLATSLFIAYGAVVVFFNKKLENFQYRRLLDTTYIILLLILILGLVFYTGNANSPVRVLLLIPVIIMSAALDKRWGLATAVALAAYLLVSSLLTDHSYPSLLFQLNSIYAGVILLVAWLVGGFADAEKSARLSLADLNQELERMISERTRELALANRKLKEKIRERWQAEVLLRESEARFRSIFENASVGVAMLDRDSVFMMVNDAFCNILGYPREEILGNRLEQFMHPGEVALKEAPIRNDYHSYVLEQRFIHKDGEIVWGRLNTSVICDQQGVPQHKIAVCEDVTSLKTKESELSAQSRIYEAMHSALQELFRPGQRLKKEPALVELASSLQVGGYEDVVASRVIEVAREATGAAGVEYFSYDADDQMFSLTSSAGMPPEFLRQAGEWLRFTLDEERGVVNQVDRQRRSLYVPETLNDPHWVKMKPEMLSCYIVPLHYGETLFGAYALLSDRVNGFTQQQRGMADTLAFYISTAMENARLFGEVQQAFERINSIQQQLLQSQKMEAVGQLAGGIAHDLNNQLTVIQASVDLSLNKAPESSLYNKAFRRIRQASERSANLIRQLLLFGRKHPQFKVLIELNQNISELKEMLERLIGEDVAVHLVLAPDLWAVRADATNIDQVILNLVINARDAMPHGGAITIRTGNVEFEKGILPERPDATGKFVCLSVSDTGAGIEKQHLPHIFEPFFTTKEPGKGTGLGLSVAYGIVDAHRGWIEVESIAGAGSTFKIYIPAEVLLDESEGPDIDLLTDPDFLRGSGESVLLVEDDPDVAALTMSLLAEHGYAVQACRTAAEALRVFQQPGASWKLVLSDVVLPDDGGINLVRQLRLKQPDLEVILFSGYGDERANLDQIQRDGLVFLPKPYTAADLLRLVREAIDHGKAFSGAAVS